MALSPKANSFFRKNPLATDLRFGINDMEEEATKTVLKYFSPPFLGAPTFRRILPGKNFIEAVRIYRAAVCFGLKAHVGHIKNSLHKAVGRDDLLLAYEELDILITSVSVEDHLFKHVVAQYARLRYTDQIPDQDELSQYVDAHPAFAKAMADVDESRTRKQEQFLAWKAREKKREEWQARKLAAEKAAAARKEEEAKARKVEKAAREPRPAVGLTRDLKPEDYARLKRLFHSD